MNLAIRLRALRVVHAVIAASVLAFAAVVLVVCQDQTGAAKQDLTVMVIALGATSVMELGASVVLRRMKMPPRDDGDAPVDLDRPASDTEARAVTKLGGASIISWAIAESIAINGMVLALLSRNILHFVPFAVVGLVAILAFAPRRTTFEAVVRAARG